VTEALTAARAAHPQLTLTLNTVMKKLNEDHLTHDNVLYHA
jgi:hypothetical protein